MKKFISANKIQYVGNWNNGLPTDKFKILRKNKILYQGEIKLSEDGFVKEGYGIELKNDSVNYEGYFKNNKREGEGRGIFEDVGVFNGLWKGGKIYNKGELIFNNGSRYIGEFNNGTFHGIGELYDWKGDLIFSGKFIDGKYEKKSQKDIFKNIPNLNLFKKAKKIGVVNYEKIKFNENPKRNNYFKNSKRISSNNDSEPAKKETNYKNIKLKISELKQKFNSIVQSDNENVDLKEV